MSVSGFIRCKLHSEAGEEEEKKGRRKGERGGREERKKGGRHREKERPTQGSLESQLYAL